MSTEQQQQEFNPDLVNNQVLLQEIQRLDPRVVDLALSNIRAEQWKAVAKQLAANSHTHEDVDVDAEVYDDIALD